MKSDETVIEQIKSGDIFVFNQLFHSIYIQLYFHCRKYIYDSETAKDLLQNVFLRFWMRREEIDIHTSLNAYLHKSVQNECLNHLRKFKTARVPDRYDSDWKNELTDDTTPYSKMIVQEIERITENTIEQLPAQCKYVFKLSRIDGLKNQDIADRLDISVRTVETQIYRALKILKRELKNYLAF